ncbi:MAG: hypothetical protein DRP09_21765 [Candidatus Thorarchaeota archaeon]|nr:MAG: hypothetical protein DRP09_21765 [Candidatus Thorarchaeota archaeon]
MHELHGLKAGDPRQGGLSAAGVCGVKMRLDKARRDLLKGDFQWMRECFEDGVGGIRKRFHFLHFQ